MSQITIQTPRGVTITGTFTRPVDCRDAAVIFSHSFLSDRHASGMFDALGRAMRRAGYATLAFDYSGHGESGDEIITFDPLIEDFRSASGWLADQGFTRQICVGHEFGATVALRARPSAVQTYVLVSPVLGPLSYDWNLVFSDVQLSDLERHGTTTVPNDSASVRRHFTINKATLADMSMVSGEKALRGIDVPVLITHDAFDEETGLLDRTRDAFHLLPDGSVVDMTAPPVGIIGEYTPVDGVPVADEAVDRALAASGSAHLPALPDVAVRWASRWVPAGR
ncbi:alpha/beta fold hydrolase [Schaalia odontolytica]|nr:alpha/beta fold hydrolase [Schaalia odontolytica]MCB6401295.1 alpha/beta fold hydrolase [Schaalia odontolytica]